MLKILLDLLPFYFLSFMFSTDHVQPIGLVFITMRECFTVSIKEVRVLVNALSVVKSCYFYLKFSRLIQITKPVK